ncbi:MAG: hypothetical protein ABSF03_35235 [Streptosporangiaceae bacterium]|jgi:hypothetical protein
MTSLVSARSRRSAMIFWSAVGICDALRDSLDARLSQPRPDAGQRSARPAARACGSLIGLS